MKRFSLLAVLVAFAGSSFSQTKPATAADMRGAYTMLKQSADTGTGEFVINRQQLKIFSGKYVMYAHRRSETDSSADFGVGTYTVENGTVIERIFYGHGGAQNNTYELTVNKRKDGYSQVVHFPGNAQSSGWTLKEDYTTASKMLTSPLDGAWNMTKLIFTEKDGKATTYNTDEASKQFKFFEGGNVMWANRITDKATGKVETGYGYGSFAVNSPAQITETNTSSTYATDLVGKPVIVKIKFTGKDSYEQTIKPPDGSKRVEFYERLK